MDILITAMIIAILLLAVAPFFLLSSAFGAPNRKKVKDANDGPVIPAPIDGSGPFPGAKKRDSEDDADSDDGSDGGDGGGGAD
jgi:hypothetical protein